MRQLMVCATAAGLIAAAAGCSSPAPRHGGPRAVLAVQTGVTDGYTTNRQEVNDEGVPLLHNLTGYPVRLAAVQRVDKPAAVHIVNAYAYAYEASLSGPALTGRSRSHSQTRTFAELCSRFRACP